MIKDILLMGNSSLLNKSTEVNLAEKDRIYPIIKDMIDTMISSKGVGIAAPQIGVFQRIVIIGFDKNPRYPDKDPVPFTVLINPKIEILTNDQNEDWEGCLSVPGLRAKILRYNKIKYSFYNMNFEFESRIAEGFHARVVQHEYDHLEGILFPMRVHNMHYFGFEEALNPN